MKMIHLLAISLFFLGCLETEQSKAAVHRYQAEVTESLPRRSKQKPVKYTFVKRIQQSTLSKEIKSSFKDVAGKTVVSEEISVEKGALRTYFIDRSQTGEKGKVEVRDRKIHFRYEKGDQVKTADEEVEGEVLVGGTIGDFVRKNWDVLNRGETISFRFAVWHRLETVGFKIVKKKDMKLRGKSAVRFEMKPTSFVIAMLVNPIKLIYEAGGDRQLIEMVGRVPTMKYEKGRWQEMDAKMRFL